jgi:hypothetical protein
MPGTDVTLPLNFILARLPAALVLLVGFIIALVRWKRHPVVSLLVSVVFGVELLISLPLGLVSNMLPLFYAQQMQTQISPSTYQWIQIGLSVTNTLVSVGVWIIVLMAIFGGRPAVAKNRNAVKGEPPV